MAGMSNYLANVVENLVLRNVSFTPPPAVYLALFDSTASIANLAANTITGEISTSGTGYARQSVVFAAASAGAIANNAIVTFAQATATWGTGGVSYAAVMDTSTAGAGNVLYYAALSSVQVIVSGNQLAINTGLLSITQT